MPRINRNAEETVVSTFTRPNGRTAATRGATTTRGRTRVVLPHEDDFEDEGSDVAEVKVPRKGRGSAAGLPDIPEAQIRKVEIPPLRRGMASITIVGDSGLLVNNKLNVAEEVAEQYSGMGKAGAVKKMPVPLDEQYRRAFYVMPDSKYPAPAPRGSYGLPASGIKKCLCSAIRTTGITDNSTIGLIQKSFIILEDGGGLCRLKFKKLERDVRAVNIGSGSKTVPQMRHRPLFTGWSIDLKVQFNEKVLDERQLINLLMHAGAYVGLAELRAEKKQGMCGGFSVDSH